MLGDYDYVVIDCPPALNMLTVNGFTAADAVIIPMQCEYYALEGLSDLVGTLRKVKQNLNPGIEIEALVRTMYDPRSTLTVQVSDELKRHYGDKVFDTVIPRNVRIAEAPSFGKPVLLHDPDLEGRRTRTCSSRASSSRAAALPCRSLSARRHMTTGTRDSAAASTRCWAAAPKARADGELAQLAGRGRCVPESTSRARAWTRPRSRSSPTRSASRGILQPVVVRPVGRRRLRDPRRRAPLARRAASRAWSAFPRWCARCPTRRRSASASSRTSSARTSTRSRRRRA